MSRAGILLRTKRLEANLSQWSLSSLLGYETPQFVSNIERGVCAMPISVAKKVAIILEVDKNLFKYAILDDLIVWYNDEWRE